MLVNFADGTMKMQIDHERWHRNGFDLNFTITITRKLSDLAIVSRVNPAVPAQNQK